jgi:glycerol-3-phosphate cytidylyltransferase
MKRVITFGTFDLFHIGHLNILKRAKEEGNYLIVGISSDELNKKKGKDAIFSIHDRVKIVESIKYVDEVFIEESLELKDDYIKQYKADLLVMGDDWLNKFNWVSCPVKYVPRTPNISTTYLKHTIGMITKD